MQTITGKLEDASGVAVHCRVTVESLSTPLFADAGVITGNTSLSVLTDPEDGTFEFPLKPGFYRVTYATTPRVTIFQIEVTETEGTVSIDDLVVTEEAAPVPAGATSITLIDQGTGLPVTVLIQNGEIKIN
jgi:hypothetical protein